MHAPVAKLLPGQRFSASGRLRLDYRAISALAFPFMLNSAVQAVLNATDTWFVSRLSTASTAAMGAVYWPILVFVFLFGGVGLSVQTMVAQAYGAGRYARASQAAWTAMWAALLTVPLFALIGFEGSWVFAPFGIPDELQVPALRYWLPRMLCAPLGVSLWAILGFFNGIGHPRVTLIVTLSVAIANAILNEVFIFDWGWGIAGSAWATGAAQMIGLAIALTWFLRGPTRRKFRSHLTTKFRYRALIGQFRLGFPMGLLYAADLLGFALFQLMQVRLDTVDGAATQLVMVLTSFCYMPAVGIAMAGTTLVGQAIGAGYRDWAQKLGNGIVLIDMIYMGVVGIALAAIGPWIIPWFSSSGDARSQEVIARALVLLWIAAAYQLFDGLNISSGACLRGAGDATLPALMVIALSWLFFVPLAHALTFAPHAGWVAWLPGFGYGAVGGWVAAVIYILLLGTMLNLRWRSGAWRKIQLNFAS